MYLSVLAPYIQTKGSTQGYFFDPVTLQQMVVGNSAAEEALAIVKVGRALFWPVKMCGVPMCPCQ